MNDQSSSEKSREPVDDEGGRKMNASEMILHNGAVSTLDRRHPQVFGLEENMKSVRKITKVWKSKPTLEGADVHLKRAFGYDHVPLFDPFLMLDDFHSNYPPHYLKGFPWHPHRGIETITYVLHGRVEHGDSMGNKGVIASGDVQWMTAGSGIIHQVFKPIKY